MGFKVVTQSPIYQCQLCGDILARDVCTFQDAVRDGSVPLYHSTIPGTCPQSGKKTRVPIFKFDYPEVKG